MDSTSLQTSRTFRDSSDNLGPLSWGAGVTHSRHHPQNATSTRDGCSEAAPPATALAGLQYLDELFQSWHERFRAVFTRQAQAVRESEQPCGTTKKHCLPLADEGLPEATARRGRPQSLATASKPPSARIHIADGPNVLTRPPPAMNVCIMIVGTRGDVQPFIAIAQRLQRDGHRVRLATHAVYRDFVTGYGVEFYPLGGDPKELAAYMVKTGGHIIPLKLEMLQKDVPRNMQMIEEILQSTWPAVSAPDPDGGGPGIRGQPFQAQAIISNPVTYGHIHVAEKLGVPLHIMFPQPWVPTVAFPHPLANMPYTGKPQKRNYLSYKLVDLLMWQGTEGLVNEFRTHTLGLRKIRTGDGGRDMLLDLDIPHAFMWSPGLVAKPKDWGYLYDVVGTVTLKGTASTYSPAPALEAFLGDDEGPIFVGFGSMVLEDPRATTAMIIEAAKQVNVRVLIQSSWSDMAGDLDIPENVFFLGNCPHDWLMPRVSSVVHHGGAGTTAAGLLAGKPTFIVPFFGDQPFWGRAVVQAGVGVEPCPIAELTTEKLRAAFEGLQSDDVRSRALTLQQKLQQEDGASEAVKSFYRHLPVQHMRCDLECDGIATKWSRCDKLKMCAACDFVVSSRPENYKKRVVDYHYVDYTARGPASGFSGTASGAGAFFHELGGAFKDVVIKPTRGFREEGPKGAVIGVVKGVSGLVIRPVHGVALFADHIAAGHANLWREEGRRKRGSIFDSHLMVAAGLENGFADSYTAGKDPDEEQQLCGVFVKKDMRRKVELRLSSEEKAQYQARFRQLLDERGSAHEALDRIQRDGSLSSAAGTSPTSSSADSDDLRHEITLSSAKLTATGDIGVDFSIGSQATDAISAQKLKEWREFSDAQLEKAERALEQAAFTSVPPMNVCLATIGTWENNVKQFVALGLRLAADGHRVRVAANESFRDEITARGLEFFPLGGAPENFHGFLKHLHDTKDANVFRRHLAGRPVLEDFKELLYSLWPAANGADPHGKGENIPGEHFRADALWWHPLLFGHVHVAERLGIPLQCASLVPLSPTFAMPHVLSSIFPDDVRALGHEYKATNWLSYGVVDAILWRGMAEIVTHFRASLGLPNRANQPSPLVDWQIPHVYLWNPSLLPKPLDWGMELQVAGYVTLEDEREKSKMRSFKWSRSLHDFTLATGKPVLFFGVSTYCLESELLDELLAKVNAAAELAQVQILFQAREGRDGQTPYHSEAVYELANDFSYALVLRKVAATIHWGEPAIVEEGLRAGKPLGVCAHLSTQYYVACMCATAQVGIPPIDLKTCTAESLASAFQELLQPDIQARAKDMAATFDPERALEKAVQSFYAKLPLRAMRCDVDERRLARVYDPRLELKLSFEAYLAIQPIRGHDGQDDAAYKPLWYDGRRPPKFSLRDVDSEQDDGWSHRDVKPKRALGPIRLAMAALVARGSSDVGTPEPPRRLSSRLASRVAMVVERPSFWASEQDEAAARTKITQAYERALQREQTEKKTRRPSLQCNRLQRALYLCQPPAASSGT